MQLHQQIITGQPHRYTGKPLDEELGLDLYYYGARYYDAELGRFTTVDPLRIKYPNHSPYIYAANNPLKFIDPNGTCFTLSENGTYVPCNNGINGDTRSGAFGNSWTYGDNGWQITHGSKPGIFSAYYTSIAADGSSNYYVSRYTDYISKYNSRPPDYYLEYGHKYNYIFRNETRPELSTAGQQWHDQTAVELQSSMELWLSSNYKSELDNTIFEGAAYGMHADAYTVGNNMFHLGISDLWKIGKTPDLSDSFGSLNGLSQIFQVGGKFVNHYYDTYEPIFEVAFDAAFDAAF